MALLSEEREKASEARQFRFANNLFDAKTVFPFCASGSGIISLLLYAVVDSATLHNLKEAPVIRTVDPFTGADLCKHRVAEHCDGGQSFNSIHPLLRQTAGLNLYRAGILPANLYLLTPSAPFTFMGCGLHCRKALLPRGRKTAPACDFKNTAPVQCVTLTAQRGKVTHAALSTCTRQLNCTSSRLDSDTAFSGHFIHKENMNRYRGGSGRSGG